MSIIVKTCKIHGSLTKEQTHYVVNQKRIGCKFCRKEKKLIDKYNVTEEQYLLMLKKQNNRCAICKNYETYRIKSTGIIRRLSVDHCHVTGKVRGLLCSECNSGISKFKDSIKYLEEAIQYLSKI